VGALTRPTRQVAGGTPLGLALLLERSGVRLVAPTQTLAPGLELLEFVASFSGPRPATAASCRERACRVDALRLRIEGVQRWAAARLVGARLPGWLVEHVAWDMLEWTCELRGVADCGAAVWLRIELQARAVGDELLVSARRCWLLGPPTLVCGRIWRALLRRLGGGPGMRARGEALVIDVARACLGPGFAAAGWRLPGCAGLRIRIEATRDAVVLGLAAGGEDMSWPEGQVVAGAEPEDPLAAVRGWLRGGAAARARAEGALQALAAEHPGVAAVLLRARVLALRFVARERCEAALGEWLRAAPDDGEARWLLAVQHACRGDSEGLLEVLRGGPRGVRQRLALALALQRVAGGAVEARALLEALVAELPGCAAELQAAVWRALARSRAGDRATPAMAVLAAVNAALGEEGWRRRDEAGELRAQVAAALVTSGRPEAETAPLLRRLLGDVRPGRWDRSVPRVDVAEGRAARRERGEGRASARIVSEYLAQEGRWPELVAVLERQLVRLGGVTRIQVLRRIARIHWHHLHDAVRAEQALRVAMEQAGEDEALRGELRAVRAELVACLELQGRSEEAGFLGEEDEASTVHDEGDEEGLVGGEEGLVGGEVVEEEGLVGGEVVEDVPVVEEVPVVAAVSVTGEDVSRDRSGGEVVTRRRALSTMLAGMGAGEAVEFGALLAGTQALALLLDVGGERASARPWLQLAAFLAPQASAEVMAEWPASPLLREVWAAEPASMVESREALWTALRLVASETAGIRAPGAASAGPQDARGAQAMVMAEAELGPLRGALGLELPLRFGCGAAEGGVGVRNERPPVIGVGGALAGLSPAERRFRLALAAVMIGGGLAIVTDPQGASLPELLAALQHLADATCPLRLPGAQTIVRALAARGFTGERLPAALREALTLELAGWQQSRVSVSRLAQLLRRDSLAVALRLSGALDGALRAIGRDARWPADEQGKLQVLSSADGQCVLRAAGLIA
jgi:hypothetical protein